MIGGPADRGSVTLPWEFVSDAPRAAWIDRFVMHTRALGIRAEPELIQAMAAEVSRR